MGREGYNFCFCFSGRVGGGGRVVVVVIVVYCS